MTASGRVAPPGPADRKPLRPNPARVRWPFVKEGMHHGSREKARRSHGTDSHDPGPGRRSAGRVPDQRQRAPGRGDAVGGLCAAALPVPAFAERAEAEAERGRTGSAVCGRGATGRTASGDAAGGAEHRGEFCARRGRVGSDSEV